jgi:(p)ppGpp synthase/HD superfamily hydrolase
MSNLNQLLSKAISIAAQAHEGQFDKQGKPYILHALFVMNEQISVKRKILGVLHDVVEDTDVTIEDLRTSGFPSDILKSLERLTHDNINQTYDEYIEEISNDEDAVAVKLADLKHNSDISRLKNLSKANLAKLHHYHKAFVYLSNV